jgi:triacylglycerol lipase
VPVPAFDHRASGYSLARAYWMCRASAAAYKDEETIEKLAGEWGFDRVRHHHTRFEPPFPLQDTQAFTMAGDHMIVTAFRGTQPAEIRDWLSDAATPPWPGPGGTGRIHYGFGEALDSVFPQVKEALEDLRTGDQTIYFTGHSLGGALAMLAGARLYFEEPRLLADGIYTYGQPRTCDKVLRAAHNNAFRDRMYRFVNNNDIVPQVPPEPVYHHVDAERYIDSSGRIRTTMPALGGLFDRARGLTADPFAPASDGIRDHFIDHYLDRLEHSLT